MQATKSRLDVAADSDEQGNLTVSDKNNRGALPRASRAQRGTMVRKNGYL